MNRNSLERFALVALLAAVSVILGPSTVYAHIGVSPTHDLAHGLAHPLTGLDHLLAMFAVGLWAAQRGGRAIWFVPLTFVLVMTLGTALGMSGVSIPFVESGIAISILVLGIFVATAARLPLWISAAIVGLFALLHGHAHGAEIPASTTGLTYVVGFILATIFLHAAGISVGVITQRLHSSPRIVRYAGAAIAVCGLLLCIR
jgi:urease accessory protein